LVSHAIKGSKERAGGVKTDRQRCQITTSKIVARAIPSFLSLAVFLLPTLLVAQKPASSATTKPFVGTWKGICADGAEFDVPKLSQREDGMAGTVSIANMEAVIDPPTAEHAMKIHDVRLQSQTLACKGAGRTACEMSIVSDGEATLKFLRTLPRAMLGIEKGELILRRRDQTDRDR
jgi:hypothetical protein